MIDNTNILVLGGTGHYGQWIVKALINKKQRVRILTRNREKAQKIFVENHDSIEFIEGDITSRETIKFALKGIVTIIIAVSAFNRKIIRKMKKIERDAILMVFEEAKIKNIHRIIYISVFDKPASNVSIPSGRIKYEIEETLEKSEFNYTILGAPPSMDIFFEMIRNAKMTVPGGGPPALPTIAPSDLGVITAEAALKSQGLKRRYRLVGPEILSFKQAAAKISVYSDKEISFRKIPIVPIRIAATILRIFRPLFPYLSQLLQFILLLNDFPPTVVETAPNDFRLLQETFDYEPTTLEIYAKNRLSLN